MKDNGMQAVELFRAWIRSLHCEYYEYCYWMRRVNEIGPFYYLY